MLIRLTEEQLKIVKSLILEEMKYLFSAHDNKETPQLVKLRSLLNNIINAKMVVTGNHERAFDVV